MGSLYGKSVVYTALKEIGYQADGKWNKYAEDLDAIDYFTGCGKKQGLDWCCVFVCWCVYKSTIPEPDKWDAHYFLYQSDDCDMAAVVKYAAQYFKDNGAWDSECQGACRGDQIFFKKSNGVYYHTGLVVDWDDEGIWTVEGNTNGGQVAKKFYKYGDSRIAGFGHPRYDGWELEEDPAEDIKPEPTPDLPETPDEPEGKNYIVCVNSFLNVRAGAGTNYPSIWKLYNDDEITVYKEENGWGEIEGGGWVCMKYLKEA